MDYKQMKDETMMFEKVEKLEVGRRVGTVYMNSKHQ